MVNGAWFLVGGSVFFGLLWVLQYFDISNSFNVLTTGSGYFTKNKIFGTIAEASAPPVVCCLQVLVPSCSFSLWLWVSSQFGKVLVTRRKSNSFLVWVIIASYGWTAGRFVFNASPAMAVMCLGIVGLWQYSGASSMVKGWRRQGIRTPGDRITGLEKPLANTPI